MSEQEVRTLTPDIPVYPNVRHFLRAIDDTPYGLYRRTCNAIGAQRGGQQERVDWTDPDAWISERLSGDEQGLARRIWRESKQELNPRYLRGCWYLAAQHALVRNEQGILRVSERGRQFVIEPEGSVVAEIDGYEGILTALRLVTERGPGRQSDLLAEYVDYCRAFTSHRGENVIEGSLYDRLINLFDRGYIERRAQTYQVTDAGLAYLARYARLIAGRVVGTKHADLQRLAGEFTQEAGETLSEFLTNTAQASFERGAAPITLIEGDKLLDLLIEFRVGVTKNPVKYIEFDAGKLAQFESEEAKEPET